MMRQAVLFAIHFFQLQGFVQMIRLPGFSIPILLLILLLAGCQPNLSQRTIRDLTLLPQSPLAYLQDINKQRPLLSEETQLEMAAKFLEQHYHPWQPEKDRIGASHPFWAIDWMNEGAVYAANLQPLDTEQRNTLTRQANAGRYPSLDRRAVTLGRVNVRALPTQSPLFNDPSGAGQGFPFDLLQHGVLPGGTPLRVTHQSLDGGWAFVETTLLYGWISLNQLAWVDVPPGHMTASARHVVITQDDVVLKGADGDYLFSASIGTVLPVSDSTPAGDTVLVPVADPNRKAHWIEVRIPQDQAESFPLVLTPLKLASLAERFMGQPYGWGDLHEGRDCSGTIRDLFAPFGFWLPRNSADQAQVGRVIPLVEHAPKERERIILSEGIPFLTLVQLPGHIMLYLGEYDGHPALLHTFWGVRTETLTGREGRWLVGKTAITTLQPGVEENGLLLKIGSLRDRVMNMNLLLD
ncbi:NlpC/P60 family N-terminal domain-containing protein [Desulfuromonas sp. AOP6]|uniref:NlpC/P60 family N-terminal domain-containing protein n=1 Tax=Desulfuromonas sp. AOP6 TaxID=1566351 RepID=UPI001277518F|nr:NlpC/P60 family N-terminal domain-containing protein [Desulfuromonas sp. AOP6]BCA79686.1 hydrolase Nlp/P60 [Desulfuromonas sp. AOP6]